MPCLPGLPGLLHRIKRPNTRLVLPGLLPVSTNSPKFSMFSLTVRGGQTSSRVNEKTDKNLSWLKPDWVLNLKANVSKLAMQSSSPSSALKSNTSSKLPLAELKDVSSLNPPFFYQPLNKFSPIIVKILEDEAEAIISAPKEPVFEVNNYYNKYLSPVQSSLTKDKLVNKAGEVPVLNKYVQFISSTPRKISLTPANQPLRGANEERMNKLTLATAEQFKYPTSFTPSQRALSVIANKLLTYRMNDYLLTVRPSSYTYPDTHGQGLVERKGDGEIVSRSATTGSEAEVLSKLPYSAYAENLENNLFSKEAKNTVEFRFPEYILHDKQKSAKGLDNLLDTLEAKGRNLKTGGGLTENLLHGSQKDTTGSKPNEVPSFYLVRNKSMLKKRPASVISYNFFKSLVKTLGYPSLST